MKNIAFVIIFVSVLIQTNAQQEYDTVIYCSPEFVGCEMSFDSASTIWGTTSFSTGFFDLKFTNCYTPSYDSNGNIIPPVFMEGLVMSYNKYKPEGFAQPYHLDSSVPICGVAARVHGDLPYYAPLKYKFYIMNEGYDELSSVIMYSSDTMQDNPKSWKCPLTNYYFDKPVNAKDFYIGADLCIDDNTYGRPIIFNHTRSVFDTTPCLDTIVGCQANYSPLLKKNGNWKRFAEDSIYEMFQKTFIEFLPIILVPKNSLEDEIAIGDEFCSIIPNPAKNKLKITSKLKIIKIEFYNISGLNIKKFILNSQNEIIDISDIKAGSYIIKLHTQKGILTKKLIMHK